MTMMVLITCAVIILILYKSLEPLIGHLAFVVQKLWSKIDNK